MSPLDTVLDMVQEGALTSEQAIAVLMIDTGRWKRSATSQLVGNAVDLVAKGELDASALAVMVDSLPPASKPKAYTIVVEHPQEDPDYVTFAPENIDVETHYLTTYYISKWNTEGITEAIENIDGWVHEALHHEDPRVRQWFHDFVDRQVSPEKFRIDWDLGQVAEYAVDDYDTVNRRHITRWCNREEADES